MKDFKKWILIIILSALFVLGIWFIIKYSKSVDVPFKSVSFSDNNFVNNRTKVNYLDTLVLAGLHQLEIKNTALLILPLQNKNVSDELSVKAHIRKAEGGYIIWIDDLSRETNIEVIAHELIHLQQYHSESLIIQGDTLFWKDQIFNIHSLPPYDQRDWETDAFSRQGDLKLKIKNILY
jgi:hypothetical protein